MLSKAKTKEDKIIEGYCFSRNEEWMIETSDLCCKDIDPSTLEYKIGEEWFSMEALKDMVDFANNHPWNNLD